MEKLVILGGAKLSGEVEISGAKNSAVAILAASIMVKGKCRIDNVPHVSDIDVLLDIINGLGGQAKFVEKGVVEIDCTNLNKYRGRLGDRSANQGIIISYGCSSRQIRTRQGRNARRL